MPWPNAELKMVAIPTANEGAPPVRANRVLSPISLASICMVSTVTGNPQEEIFATATAASLPTIPAGLLMAKYTPGSSTQAAITAMIATRDSNAMLP